MSVTVAPRREIPIEMRRLWIHKSWSASVARRRDTGFIEKMSPVREEVRFLAGSILVYSTRNLVAFVVLHILV